MSCSTHHYGDVDVVTIPATLLRALECGARVKTMVTLRTDAQAGDIGERVGCVR